MVTISPATKFADVTRIESGHSETFSRTVTASPDASETIVSTTLTLQREFFNLVLEPGTTASADSIILEDGSNLLLDGTNLSGADAGDKVLRESAVEDASLLLEDATNDSDEEQSNLDKLIYEDYVADTEPNITITNGVTTATTSGFYSRKFNDIAKFIPREESKDKRFDDLELTGIDNMPLDINDTSVEGRPQLMHEFNQDTTSSYTFLYNVEVCFFKTETLSETDPITGVTTEHEIKQPTECVTFMLSHDVLNDLSFAPNFVGNYFAPLE